MVTKKEGIHSLSMKMTNDLVAESLKEFVDRFNQR